MKDNDIEVYSIHNEGKSVVAERFIRTLKTKIYKYMASVSKKVYIDKLDDIVVEYNNTYHRTIKIKPVDVKDNTYINFNKEDNDKDPKFKVGDHVRISKYKNILQKDTHTLVALQRIKMSQYFPKPYQPFGGDINVKVDLNKLLVLQVLH